LPKRIVDTAENEIMRGVRLTTTTVEYVSFKVPRKAGSFSADLFPPCKSTTPAGTFEDYWAGQDKEYLRVDLREIQSQTESPTQI